MSKRNPKTPPAMKRVYIPIIGFTLFPGSMSDESIRFHIDMEMARMREANQPIREYFAERRLAREREAFGIDYGGPSAADVVN